MALIHETNGALSWRARRFPLASVMLGQAAVAIIAWARMPAASSTSPATQAMPKQKQPAEYRWARPRATSS